MSLVRLVILFCAFGSTVPGCGLLSSGHHHDAGAIASDRRRVGVEVQSHNWSDITVYLLSGGLPQRLGMVTALGNATFDFPSQRLYTSGGVRLRALPVAGRAFTSETILVLPGQVITWTLENDLDRSSFSVY
jgi:hypothetical protein